MRLSVSSTTLFLLLGFSMKLTVVASNKVLRTKQERTTLSSVEFDSTVLLDESSYTFEQFLSEYGFHYDDPKEYEQREAIFKENLATIVKHNNQNKLKSNGGGYWMGVNEFADKRAEELHRGYDKYQSSRRKKSVTSVERRLDEESNNVFDKLNIKMESIDDLPKSIDWRMKGVTTPIKSQGMCGSCWAFASTATLESHIAINTGVLYDLSPQELVSCAPNKNHCGGNGGCTGATSELAYDLVKSHGMVQEWDFGYEDGHGGYINCTIADKTFDRDDKTYYRGAVVGITDYAVLPSNNYTALMNTVAKLGPVAVSVACLPWHLYQSGVFYAPLTSGKSTDLDHLVVLEGYGTDQDTGEDYYIVRNSWGPRWGESGRIRLKRVGDKECGVDETPGDGTACTLDPDGNPIDPKPQTICGNSGILFDSTIPLGGYLL